MGLLGVCLLGIFGCAITLFVGFIPPGNINIGSRMTYEMIFCGGMVGMVLPILFFYWYHHSQTAAKNIRLIPQTEIES